MYEFEVLFNWNIDIDFPSIFRFNSDSVADALEFISAEIPWTEMGDLISIRKVSVVHWSL